METLSFKGTPSELMEYIGEQICEYCHGIGEVYILQMDSDGLMSDTETEPCECQYE